ncbi:Endonuclease III [invertebrate metagenome]|uniref:Endonuclease III n=1 Tax=invertebrate metagenome TaxID=1711999 RepID=A0A484H6P8_9ZZZZ
MERCRDANRNELLPLKRVSCMAAAKAESFFHRLAVANPVPRSELIFYSPYTLLVAVVLSAQATDRSVNNVTRSLFLAADTPSMMVALGEDGVKAHIRTIGLFHNKARYIIAMSRLLIDDHGSKVPSDRASLEKLPGVGRKSASVVLNIAFFQPIIAVDTHVFRVCNRSGIAKGYTPLEVEEKLESIVPDRYRLHAHNWLVLHGRYVCKARTAHCIKCNVQDLCESVHTQSISAK